MPSALSRPMLVARLPAQRRETAAHQDLPVRLHRQRQRQRSFAPGLKVGVQRAVGIEPADVVARLPAQRREVAAHQDLPVRLHRQGVDGSVRARIETRVERAVGIDPRDVVTRGVADNGELAAQQDLAVRLHRQDVDGTVRVGIEAGVDLLRLRDAAQDEAGKHHKPHESHDLGTNPNVGRHRSVLLAGSVSGLERGDDGSAPAVPG